MNRQTTHQLEKVLALADSAHDGEAAAAVRKARQLLSRDGLSFSDLARAAQRPSFGLSFFSSSGPKAQLELQLVRLRQQLQELQSEIQAQAVETEVWRSRAEEMERKLGLTQPQAKRRNSVAKDTTAEKLWDLGQSLQEDVSE